MNIHGKINEVIKLGGSLGSNLLPSLIKENYKDIADVINDGNRRSLVTYSTLCSFFMLIVAVLSVFLSEFSGQRLLYIVSFAALALISAASHFILPTHLGWTDAFTAVFLCVLNFFGIYLGTVMTPDRAIVSFIAILILEVIPFADVRYRLKLVHLISMVICTVMVIKLKPAELIQVDLVNIWVYGLIGFMGGIHTTRVRTLSILQSYHIGIIAETDMLTGLRNRNCYEKQLGVYSSVKAENLTCIYVDVNGLHNINNSKGHAAGDRMLKYIASEMQKIFGKEHTYRIGGDEFVAFCFNSTEEETRPKISALSSLAEEAAYHISVGYEFAKKNPDEDLDMAAIISSAETHMYREKEVYYAISGYHRV